MKRHVFSWLTLFRLGATARGVLPFLLGAVIAWSQGNPINIAVLILSTFAVIFIMLMTFLVNEYYDYEGDILNKEFHRLSGGSRVLPMGLLPRRYSLIGAYVFLLLAGIIGLILQFYYKTGSLTLVFGVIAVIIGYFYTAKPFRWSYNGLGELAIWFSCGWLANVTGYYLQTGRIDLVTTLISFPGATSVFLLILMNEVPDINADRKVGKRNLVVRLGVERTAWLYNVLLVLCFINMIVIIPFGVPPVTALLAVILLPLITWNIVTIRKYGLSNQGIQEKMSLSTMLIDHLITLIYTAGFIVAGLQSVSVHLDYLLVIAIAYVFVFSLEGLGLLSSKMVAQG